MNEEMQKRLLENADKMLCFSAPVLCSNRNGADEMITQDEAIQMAREAGASTYINAHSVALSNDQLTALCNKVRTQTLLEAAEYVSRNLMSPREYAEELRRMAGEE